MKNSWPISLALFVALFVFASVDAHAKKNHKKHKRDDDKHFVFNLVGLASAEPGMVPDPEGEKGDMMEADCFTVDLVDLKSEKIIGTAVDCLSKVEDLYNNGELIRLIGTTTFHLKKGSFTTQGYTTVAKAQFLTVSPSVGDITHITGAAGDGNAIISGTKKYKKAKGTSRLSGLVNLADLADLGEITFDCIFVVDLY
jgi:hypothetical protein